MLACPLWLKVTLFLGGVLNNSLGFVIALLSTLFKTTPCRSTYLPKWQKLLAKGKGEKGFLAMTKNLTLALWCKQLLVYISWLVSWRHYKPPLATLNILCWLCILMSHLHIFLPLLFYTQQHHPPHHEFLVWSNTLTHTQFYRPQVPGHHNPWPREFCIPKRKLKNVSDSWPVIGQFSLILHSDNWQHFVLFLPVLSHWKLWSHTQWSNSF